MEDLNPTINASYETFYAKRSAIHVYPTEFVVRTFLANYPRLSFKKPLEGDRILDVAFGDGRNTAFLCEQKLAVSGIEITQGIVDQTASRLAQLGHSANLKVGRNSSIPFESGEFHYILACHCCYYCDEGETFEDNLAEYARVLKPDGWLVASVASAKSYIFKDATPLPDGSFRVNGDPYHNRNGYRLHAFHESQEVENYFSKYFKNLSLGYAHNNYYGISEQVFWIVGQKR